MLKITCTNCNNRCCQNPLTPILLVSEEEKFIDFSKLVQTAFRDMKVLKKKDNETCIFLDNEKKLCSNYENRPLECKIYPYLLDFSSGETNIKLDTRFCPSLHTLSSDVSELLDYVRGFQYSEDWIKAYDSMQGTY